VIVSNSPLEWEGVGPGEDEKRPRTRPLPASSIQGIGDSLQGPILGIGFFLVRTFLLARFSRRPWGYSLERG